LPLPRHLDSQGLSRPRRERGRGRREGEEERRGRREGEEGGRKLIISTHLYSFVMVK
jgi:hypothetical protein